jgi:signal transduction histidine kinase
MLERLRELAAMHFGPHGNCYGWTRELIWLQAGSDALIGLAYVAISLTLAYLVYRLRRRLPFPGMFLAFGLFIIACGATHFMEIWVIYEARYWLQGSVKLVTAVASMATAVLLPPLVPRALALVRTAELSEERRRRLETANQELQTLYQKVRALDELKTEFFANVSHELRTPLALVLGPAERMLAGGTLAEDQRHDLGVVARNARTLIKHVNDLLDVSKLEAGRMEVRYAEADLSRLVRFTASHFDALARERDIACTVETPPEAPAQVDADKVQRVLLNLLSNAFKFVGDHGRVRCALKVENGRAVLAVEDNGPGVPPELRGVIFERFRQGEGGTGRRFGGTGLGLAIARDFVGLHGGTIAVDDAPGGGARFTVVLPTRAPAGAKVEPAPADADLAGELARQAAEELRPGTAEPAGPPPGGDRALVLVVEDNADMRQFIAETLAPDYRTASAADGRQGLAKATELRPDLVLSDVMMPLHGGDELVRKLRSRPELNAVPVVLLTARADDGLRVRLLSEGAQDYLTKPFSAAELRARVGNLIAMKRARDVLQAELSVRQDDLEELAREVARRKRELQTALEGMRVARAHAEQAGQARTDFLSLVSHELRTPLTSISLYLQALQRGGEGALAPRQLEVLRKIGGSSGRLQEMIDMLLEYIAARAGRLVRRVEAIDLPALAAAAVEDLQPQAEQKGLELRLDAAEGLAPLWSDAGLVRLVLVNLAGNAIKYTERGRVEVRLSYGDGRHRLAVRDTGPGIPVEQQALVFEPFTQLEPLRYKHKPGIGLGLALVREVVRALQGEIDLTSRVGEGTTFTVQLPPLSADEEGGQDPQGDDWAGGGFI